MSFRRRQKPMIAASAVAKARSRPNEKTNKDKLSSEEKVHDAPTLQQEGASASTSNSYPPSSEGVIDSCAEQEAKEGIKYDDSSKTTLKASLFNNKRFTKVRNQPILNRKSMKEDSGADDKAKEIYSNESFKIISNDESCEQNGEGDRTVMSLEGQHESVNEKNGNNGDSGQAETHQNLKEDKSLNKEITSALNASNENDDRTNDIESRTSQEKVEDGLIGQKSNNSLMIKHKEIGNSTNENYFSNSTLNEEDKRNATSEVNELASNESTKSFEKIKETTEVKPVAAERRLKRAKIKPVISNIRKGKSKAMAEESSEKQGELRDERRSNLGIDNASTSGEQADTLPLSKSDSNQLDKSGKITKPHSATKEQNQNDLVQIDGVEIQTKSYIQENNLVPDGCNTSNLQGGCSENSDPIPKQSDSGVLEKEANNKDQSNKNVPTLKGRFKRRNFMPNIGKRSTNTDEESLTKKKEIDSKANTTHSEQVENQGSQNVANADKDLAMELKDLNSISEVAENKQTDMAVTGVSMDEKTDKVKEIKPSGSEKRFRRAKIKPMITNNRIGKNKAQIKPADEDNTGNGTLCPADGGNTDSSEICKENMVKIPSEERNNSEISKPLTFIRKDSGCTSVELSRPENALDASFSTSSMRLDEIVSENGNNGINNVCLSSEKTSTGNQDSGNIKNVIPDANEIACDKSMDVLSENQSDKPKKVRRTRFKPNVNVTDKRKTNNIDTSKPDQKSNNSKLDTEKAVEVSNGNINKGNDNDLDYEEDKLKLARSSKKHVRFPPNLNAGKDLKSTTESHKTDANSDDCNKTDKPSPDKDDRSLSGSKAHSDAEDGSQSESEGLHYHGKRRFAPYLGPKVRQRRRLSSMTYSDDEGISERAADGTEPDKNKESSFAIVPQDGSDKQAGNGKKHSTKDADGKKKAKKRTRIVMKEPKEKMTMFDYIYYNPQSTEQEPNGAEPKEKKRRQDEPNIAPETETILETLGFGEDRQDAAPPAEAADDLNEIEDDDNQILAPRVRIGEDGNIIIDEESLVLKTTRSKISLEGSRVHYDDGTSSFKPYQRRKDGNPWKKTWPVQETLKFYRTLSRVGTDFSLMLPFFPDCTRRVLKRKFKMEEKFNGDLIDRALKHMLPMDEALFEELENNKDERSTENQLKKCKR